MSQFLGLSTGGGGIDGSELVRGRDAFDWDPQCRPTLLLMARRTNLDAAKAASPTLFDGSSVSAVSADAIGAAASAGVTAADTEWPPAAMVTAASSPPFALGMGEHRQTPFTAAATTAAVPIIQPSGQPHIRHQHQHQHQQYQQQGLPGWRATPERIPAVVAAAATSKQLPRSFNAVAHDSAFSTSSWNASLPLLLPPSTAKGDASPPSDASWPLSISALVAKPSSAVAVTVPQASAYRADISAAADAWVASSSPSPGAAIWDYLSRSPIPATSDASIAAVALDAFDSDASLFSGDSVYCSLESSDIDGVGAIDEGGQRLSIAFTSDSDGARRPLHDTAVSPARERHHPLHKTELCRTLEETGSCKYGTKCQFAHSEDELRAVARHPKWRTKPCKTFWSEGTCPYGKRCGFIHLAQDALPQPPPPPPLANVGPSPPTPSAAPALATAVAVPNGTPVAPRPVSLLLPDRAASGTAIPSASTLVQPLMPPPPPQQLTTMTHLASLPPAPPLPPQLHFRQPESLQFSAVVEPPLPMAHPAAAAVADAWWTR
ncbi:hypothetical protein HK405_003078 [Cladochytrium tenue]|nr:hypothetical protein HK405_003078 [Cladochytrium tenue]